MGRFTSGRPCQAAPRLACRNEGAPVGVRGREIESVHSLLVAPLVAVQGGIFGTSDQGRALGRTDVSELKRPLKPLSGPRVDACVNRTGAEWVAQLRGRPFAHQFEVILGGAWIEPFALPGGSVFVYIRAFARPAMTPSSQASWPTRRAT
jgi:hypothetical protein